MKSMAYQCMWSNYYSENVQLLSSILSGSVSWTEEPGGLQSIVSQ